MRKSFFHQLEINSHARKSGRNHDSHRAIAQCGLASDQSSVNHVFDGCGFKLELHFARIQTRHLGGFANQPVQPVAFFIDDDEKILSLRVAESRVGQKVCHRSFNRRERSSQVVRDRLSQSRTQTLALACGFGLSQLFDRAGTLHGHGDQRTDCLQRLAGKSRTGNSQAADRAHSQPNGNEAETIRNINHRLFSSHDGFQAVDIQARNHRA